jgi:restriction system protein
MAAARVRMLEARKVELTLAAVIVPGDKTAEGTLIEAVALPWFEIVKMLERDPDFRFRLNWRKWEEIIGGAYVQAGFDSVTVTPRSGDGGRDIIATKDGVGSIRIIDQVKAYSPHHVVTAEEVRAMFGVLSADPQSSKAVVTTTSTFAPGVKDDALLKQYMPYRLELKSGAELIKWLRELAGRQNNPPAS